MGNGYEVKARALFFLCCLLGIAWAAMAAAAPEFQDVLVYRIERSEGLDLSGLTLCRDDLYAVSDKRNILYRIRVDDDRVSVEPALHLPPIPKLDTEYVGLVKFIDRIGGPGLDWEDVVCTDRGFFLLSERKNAILRIAGGRASWLPVEWYAQLHGQGYLNRYNAMVEGLARIDDEHWLVAIEREPRGLIRLSYGDGRWWVDSAALGNEQQLVFRDDNPDVSALLVRGDRLYTLERNASAICRRDLEHLRAQSCYSFDAIERSAEYRYSDDRYGKAEGLAMDEQWIYVVFDNNGAGFAANPGDRRALFLKIPIPMEWLD